MKDLSDSASAVDCGSAPPQACGAVGGGREGAEGGESNFTRPTWSRKIEFTLAAIGYSVGLGNVWRFPFLCYRSGGGAFLIPFLILLVLVGIPLLYMEIAIGQYLRVGPIKSLAKVCPLFKGVGMASVAISFIMSIYYNLIITWALYYLINSFHNPLPWQSCNNTWNIPETCTNSITTSNTTVSASQQYFDYNVLQKTEGLHNLGSVRWELFGLLILAWVIVYFCIFKGVAWTGKIVYFTSLFPYVVLLAILINNVQLPGAIEGIKYFVTPKWEKLTELQVWVNAAVQVFNSIGIGFGTLISMASYNTFDNTILKETLAISLTNSATSLFSGFVIFSAFGYMSYMINIPIDDIAVDGPGLVFVVYPEAFITMPLPPLWAVLFFFMLLFLGLDSQFAMVEVLVTSLMDSYRDQLLRVVKRMEFVVLTVCVFAFLLGIPNVTQGGVYVFQLMDHYTAKISIVFLAFFEVISISYIYGVRRLCGNIEAMLGKGPGIFFRACWLVISPALVTIIMVFVVIQFEPARYGSYVYPAWGQGVGWIVALASLIWIPIGAVHTLFQLKGSLLQRLMRSLTPFGLESDSKESELDMDLPPPYPGMPMGSTHHPMDTKTLPNTYL